MSDLEDLDYSGTYVWEYPGDEQTWNYFDISNNQFCVEPYPSCVQNYIGIQKCP